MASDTAQLRGMAQCVRSIFASTRSPERLHVHLLRNGPSRVYNWLDLNTLGGKVTLDSVMIGNHTDTVFAQIVRAYLPRLFVDVGHMMWIDNDFIVRRDVVPLLQEAFAREPSAVLAVVPRGELPKDAYPADLRVKLGIETVPNWNAGLFLMNCREWRRRNVVAEVDQILRTMIDRGHSVYSGLSFKGVSIQRPLNILSSRYPTQRIDGRWNVDGLGWNKSLRHKTLCNAWALHWSGSRKPWLPQGMYRNMWNLTAPCQSTVARKMPSK